MHGFYVSCARWALLVSNYAEGRNSERNPPTSTAPRGPVGRPQIPRSRQIKTEERECRKKKRDKRRYGGGRNMARPRAKKRGISPWGTYGANTSADLAQHSMAEGDKGGLSPLYHAPIFGNWKSRAAFRGYRVSLTRCMNILRAQPSSYIVYLRPDVWGNRGGTLSFGRGFVSPRRIYATRPALPFGLSRAIIHDLLLATSSPNAGAHYAPRIVSGGFRY